MKKNIEKVVNSNHCSGCGACTFICSHISMIINEKGFNIPKIDNGCKNCGRCLEICPSNNTTTKYFNNKFYQSLKGKNCYIAYAKDNELRFNGASGAFVTALLIDLLERKVIDGCIVAFSDGKFENTKAIVATTKKQILDSRSSKYMPISMCTVLKELDETKKYVFVGKGCDIKGLTLLQEKFPKLKSSIILKIGIMCAGSPSLNASKVLYKKMTGFDYENEYSNFVYRYQGWPGNCVAKYKEEIEVKIPYTKSWSKNLSKDCNPYCRLCLNHFPEDADIIVGDAWFKNKNLELLQDGFSLLLFLNSDIKQYINNEIVYLESCKEEDFKYSQEYIFDITEKAFLYDFFLKFFVKKNYLYFNLFIRVLKMLLKHNYKFIRYLVGNYIRFNRNVK